MKILITGSTSGIGRQLALDYALDGHEVWGIGRNAAKLAELEKQNIHTARVDLTNYQETMAWFGSLEKLDLAILNAGTCEYLDMPSFDSAMVSRVMRGNIESMAISIEGAIPLLQKGTRPHLVGVGSSAAYLPLPRAEAYGSSKAAIEYMMKTLQITLAPHGIDVSLVCPGFVKTPLTDKNDFAMPFLIDTVEASRSIRDGIKKRKKEIHFPKRLTYTMKILSMLPPAMWRSMAKRMVGK